MIDKDGFRENVGIILANKDNYLFWARRLGHDAWQFPQGGTAEGESAEETMYRELLEEVGLEHDDVEVLGSTKEWLKYRLPDQYIRHYSTPLCIGQKQKWFLLRLLSSDQKIRLDISESPEFDSWRWVEYWYPVRQIISFKRQVYRRALQELEPLLFPDILHKGE